MAAIWEVANYLTAQDSRCMTTVVWFMEQKEPGFTSSPALDFSKASTGQIIEHLCASVSCINCNVDKEAECKGSFLYLLNQCII